jgi:hypothetical protein
MCSDEPDRHDDLWIGVVLVLGVPAILVLLIRAGGPLMNPVQP